MAEVGGQDQNNKELLLDINVKFDPSVFDDFKKALGGVKTKSSNVAKGLKKDAKGMSGFLKKTFGNIKGWVLGVGTAITGAFTGRQIIEKDALVRQFKHAFGPLVPLAKEYAEILRNQFYFSRDDAAEGLIDLSKRFKVKGLGKEESLRAAFNLLARSRDLSSETGIDPEKTLQALTSFAEGSYEPLLKILGKDHPQYQAVRKWMAEIAADPRRDKAELRRNIAGLLGLTTGFEGATARDPSLHLQRKGVENNIEDIISNIAEKLIPAMDALTDTVYKATKNLDRIPDIITKILGFFDIITGGIFGDLFKLLSNLKDFTPIGLLKKRIKDPRTLKAFQDLYDFAEKNRDKIEGFKEGVYDKVKGFGKNLSEGGEIPGHLKRTVTPINTGDIKGIKEGIVDTYETISKGLKEFSEGGEIPGHLKRTITPINQNDPTPPLLRMPPTNQQSNLTNTNNINLTINAQTNDPEKLAEMATSKIQEALDDRIKGDINLYTTGVIG